MRISRRTFIRGSALAVLSAGLLPSLLWEALAAAAAPDKKKILVVIFQRGACDGLSLVAPYGDPHYAAARPTISLSPVAGDKKLIKLDGFFGLHPAMAPLASHWNDGTLAFIHQVGSPDTTRSHFDAQDFMESGTPGVKVTQDGYLNRALGEVPENKDSPLRAVALLPTLPRSLMGPTPALSMNSIHEFGIQGNATVVKGFEDMYQSAVDKSLRGVGQEVFEALGTVRSTEGKQKGKRDDDYPRSDLARRLREIAQLIKADVGLRVAATDIGGWDTHVNQGAGQGQLAGRFTELGEALAAFASDLGPRFQDVCVMTMTEFGRTVKENGNRGTDHGHGSVMTVLGGNVNGRKVYSEWKDLAPENLFEGRDVPVTTDFRDVLGEVLTKELGVSDLQKVFPAYSNSPYRWRGVLKG